MQEDPPQLTSGRESPNSIVLPFKSATEMNSETRNDPRVPFAAERTLLAWIRTSLAMMGFGFVVARFGLFLREMSAVSQNRQTPISTGFSVWAGMGLVVLGAVVASLAAVRHVRFLDQWKSGEKVEASRWSLAVVVAVLLSLIGAAMAAYLFMRA